MSEIGRTMKSMARAPSLLEKENLMETSTSGDSKKRNSTVMAPTYGPTEESTSGNSSSTRPMAKAPKLLVQENLRETSTSANSRTG